MAVDLIYKHQQKTYDLMNEALEENGRAAYVYPTGCGKSFPALKYVEDNSEKSATIVVPSNFIKKQYEKNIKKYVENGSERLKSGSIKIVTYQERNFKAKKHESRVRKIKNYYRNKISQGINVLNKSLKLSKNLIPFMESDIVIFDEIHRMGAPEWEKIVDKMMKENPKRKVIGMSATPERTNRRNMAYEKFGDDVVYEMSLTEALSGEKEGEVLLKSPNYVRVLSLLKAELPNYKEQIDLLEDEEKKEKCLKAYQKLDSIVSNSPDIQDIIAAGMKKTNGKYIVFCKDRDDMFDKIEHANEIFGKVNSKINIDYVITKKSGGEDAKGKTKVENDKTLEEFEARENGDGLNLLFCVDMLNEGVHLDGIDGEILFDLTSSPILYKQRIGRVLSSDKNAGDAVIIDAANNWLAQIETYREIEMAIQAGRKREKEDKEKDWDLLKLLPEEIELIEILREIGEELKYNQGTYLSRALQVKEWCEKNYGNKPIEERYLPSNGKEADEEEKRMAVLLKSVNDYFKRERKVANSVRTEHDIETEEIIRMLYEEYGISETLKNAIKIKKWCEKNYGDKPREERCLPSSAKGTSEEENKIFAYLNRIRFFVMKQHEGKMLEEIEDEEQRKIVAIMRTLEREYGLTVDLKHAIIVKKWCEKKYGDKPREERCLPSNGKEADEEEKRMAGFFKAVNDHLKRERKVTNSIINEHVRETKEIIRMLYKEYGISETLKNAIKIKKWCEENYGDKPREERYLPSVGEEADDEEKFFAIKLQEVKKILNQYEGVDLENITDENHKETVEIIRMLYKEYGISETLKNAIKIKKWCKKNFEGKPKEERRLPSHSKTADEEERRLALEFNKINTFLKKYSGIPIEDIKMLDYKEIAEIISFLEENYRSEEQKAKLEGDSLKNAINIQEWCKKNYGDKPREERCLPSLKEDSSDDEKRLAMYFNNIKNTILKKYEGRLLEEIEDEKHREIVKIARSLLKEFGLSKYLKNAIQIKKWCEENYGDKPREERKIPRRTEMDENECDLSIKYKTLRSKICSMYEGESLEEIVDEEHREIVEIIRYLDENFMSEEQKNKRDSSINKKMKQAVGKQVAHNEETRQELEGQNKTLVVEDSDLEK